MSKFLASAAVVSAMILASSLAMAGDGDKSKIETKQDGDNYGYDFEDDLLDANVMGAESGMIKVRQGAVRRTLIRPRTHFVPELLKSIELI